MSLVTSLRANRFKHMAARDPAEYYSVFSKPEALMRAIDTGYAVLAAALCSDPFFSAGGRDPDRYSQRFRDVANGAMLARENGEVSHEMRVTPEYTEVSVTMPEITVQSYGLGPQPTPQQAGDLQRARRILKSILPGLDLEKVVTEDYRTEFPLDEERTKREMPIEALTSINVPGVPKLELSDWVPPLRGSVVMSIVPRRLTTSEATNRITDHTDVYVYVEVRALVRLPREYVTWAQTASDEDYVPLATWLHFCDQREWAAGRAKKSPPERLPHPDSVGKQSKRAAETYRIPATRQTDENDICVVPDGKMLYVPTVPDASVSGMMNECLRDGKVDLTPIRNRHVMTDWVTSKMAYSDVSGTIRLVNLTGARPPSPQSIAHVAGWQVDFDLLTSMGELATQLGAPIDLKAVTLEGVQEDLCWINLICEPYFGSDETGSQKQLTDQRLLALGKQIGVAYQKLVNSSVPLMRQIELRPWFALFGAYADKMPEFRRALVDQIAHHRMAVDPKGTPHLYDMPGVEGVMPHQRRVFAELATKPRGAILDVRAGGGKSISCDYDVLNLMASGEIKRPVCIMPRNLLAPFANEITRFSQGRFRAFVVSNRMWRGMIRRLDANPVGIIDLMRRQPKNTIFLVDYGWLTHNSENVTLGEDSHSFYPHAAMLAAIGPDYCCLDESHRAKRTTSGRTLAAAMITGVAKYRRIMSGTLLHNTAADLLGQMAQIEPMALGNLGTTIRENRRVSISQLPELRRCTDAFARSVSVPRKEWAHLLPPLIERVHPCELTPKQRDFYTKIFEKLQRELYDDPKIKALMKKDSDAAEARMMAIFRRKFVPLEQWLNAPDSEFSHTQFGQVFSQIDGLTEADLRSPKIDVLDQLLEEHLHGGTISMGGDSDEQVPPSGNKAIIFAYNRAVIDHVYRHSKFAPMGVLYFAGDDEALDRFKNDDSVKFLYAAVTSVSEGHNLQMADRLITLTSYWTPGLMEQSLARVWRPDVPDKDGKIKYKRDRIWSDQILIAPSVEVAKMARLISKQVNNLLVEEIDSSPALKKIVVENESTFGGLKNIRMNLDYLKKLQDQAALGTYFRAYSLIKTWERKEFAEARDRVRAEVEAKVGRKVSNGELAALSMTRPENTNTPDCDVPNAVQAQGFVPWSEGFSGWSPPGLHLVPLEMPSNSDEEEEEEDEGDDDGDAGESTVKATVGDPVWTELGPGYLTSVRAGSRFVMVRIPGYRREPVKMWRYAVLAATNAVDKRAIDIMLKRAGEKGLPTLTLNDGQLVPQRNLLPVEHVTTVRQEAERALKLPPRRDVPPRAGVKSTPPVGFRPATRDDLIRERGRISVGNHEVVLMRNKNTGATAWIVRHQSDPKDRSKPFPQDQKRAAVDELLRRHNAAQQAPVAGRGKPLSKDDPFTSRPGKTNAPTTPPARAPGAKKSGLINLNDVSQHEEQRDEREAAAGVFSGTVCLVTTDGGDRDELLLKSGFDRLARRLDIRVKNPRAFKTLVQLLLSKFDVPDMNRKALLQFAAQYQASKAQVAYLKSKELPQHQAWLRQQRLKAKTPTMIMPWPIVRDGLVYVTINAEQLQTKAIGMLKRLTLPIGCARPVVQAPRMIAMLQSVSSAKVLMKTLERRGVDITNAPQVLAQLRKIKG